MLWLLLTLPLAINQSQRANPTHNTSTTRHRSTPKTHSSAEQISPSPVVLSEFEALGFEESSLRLIDCGRESEP